MWLETATPRVHSSIRQSIGFLIRRLWVRFPLNAPFLPQMRQKTRGRMYQGGESPSHGDWVGFDSHRLHFIFAPGAKMNTSPSTICARAGHGTEREQRERLPGSQECVCSSVEERCLAMAEVAGSNPARCFEIAPVDANRIGHAPRRITSLLLA